MSDDNSKYTVEGIVDQWQPWQIIRSENPNRTPTNTVGEPIRYPRLALPLFVRVPRFVGGLISAAWERIVESVPRSLWRSRLFWGDRSRPY